MPEIPPLAMHSFGYATPFSSHSFQVKMRLRGVTREDHDTYDEWVFQIIPKRGGKHWLGAGEQYEKEGEGMEDRGQTWTAGPLWHF